MWLDTSPVQACYDFLDGMEWMESGCDAQQLQNKSWVFAEDECELA